MSFYPTERTAVFIDGANLYHTMKELGWDLDFGLISGYFAKQSLLMRPYYFTALRDEGGDPVVKLASWLRSNGYSVISKPLKTQSNHSAGTYHLKGNMDVEITVYMIGIAQHVDHLVLFSGDGDFSFLIERLQDMGKRVTVVSTLRSKNKVCADDLRRQADFFLDLEDLNKFFNRDAVARTKAAIAKA
ncbi:MAG TPA: NYN domain-containing protein [Acidobacteriaceae bacterium]